MIFLDTGGLLCVIDQDEERHEDAATYFAAMPRGLTHNYVLAECVALFPARGIPRPAMITFLDGLQSNPLIEVVFVDAALHQKAWTLLKQRPDKEWTLCDVVSFLLMQQRGLTEALATDHHFAQAGFRALLEKT